MKKIIVNLVIILLIINLIMPTISNVKVYAEESIDGISNEKQDSIVVNKQNENREVEILEDVIGK